MNMEVSHPNGQANHMNGDLQAIFESVDHPIILVDAERRVVRANTAARSFKTEACEIFSQLSADLPGARCGCADCPVKQALSSGRPEEAEIFDGASNRWVHETAVPLLDESGAVHRIVLFVQDITGQKLAEDKLRHALEEIEDLKSRLRAETECFKAETGMSETCGEITGQNKSTKEILHQIRLVAPTDSAVLICGETGTGKELVADAIHRLSPRKARSIVKVNCAALPPPLVESELFGREKGAYTGALSRQSGRFELADQSTIFLDEIGELSMEVQAKLLRVLQEGQFERLGSPRTVKVNVRLIAATNRDLAEEVRKGHFRQDLYYRLNVFPIKVPPLRERAEDIPVLVWTFLEEFSARMGKKITQVPRKSMEALQNYSWPGNVRELRNVIERSVIISPGDTLRIALSPEMEQSAHPLTLADNTREHILRVLNSTLWHIKGPSGAAIKLGMKPSTLYTRMHKLGIPNRRQRDGIRT